MSDQTTPTVNEQSGFFSEIWHRRVPQIVGSYLLGSFGIIQFLEWAAGRQMFSDHVTLVVFRFLLLILPSVIMWAWFHGRRGPDSYRKIEKIFIPLNILAALLSVSFLSAGMDMLRPDQARVLVVDEDGNQIERIIPAADAHKRIDNFFYINKSGNAELDYLQLGITYGIFYDLMQDMIISQSASFTDANALQKAAAGGNYYDLSLPAQLKLAKDSKSDHFISGEFTKKGDQFEVISRMYNTATGKLELERTEEGPDVMEIIDRITLDLRKGLKIPDYHLDETTDLPIGELLSNNTEAYKNFIIGMGSVLYRNDYVTAVKMGELATSQDPNFGMAWFLLMQHYANGTESAKSGPAMERTMELLNQFPERLQFLVKSVNYIIKQQPDKVLKIYEMWVELYPTDISAYASLATTYTQRERFDDAIATYEKALEYDDNHGQFLEALGQLYTRKGEFEKAANVFDQLTERYPGGTDGLLLSANLYRTTGKYEKALANYERVLLMDPANITVQCRVASIAERQGKFDLSVSMLEEALQSSRTPMDRALCMEEISSNYASLLQYRNAMEWSRKSLDEYRQFTVPINLAFRQIDEMVYLIKLHDTTAAREKLQEINSHFTSLYANAVGFSNGAFAIETENISMAEKALEQVLKFNDIYGSVIEFVVNVEVGVAELKEEYDTGIEVLLEYMRDQPGISVRKNVSLARLYRLKGDLPNALKHINKVFDIYPELPAAHYEKALILHAAGKNSEAAESLEKSLMYWSDADPEVETYQEALLLKKTLQNS